MPSIVDVAREAGVSTATVSRAINTPEKVAQKTRRRVNAAIEKLQYNPEENRSTLSAALTPHDPESSFPISATCFSAIFFRA